MNDSALIALSGLIKILQKDAEMSSWLDLVVDALKRSGKTNEASDLEKLQQSLLKNTVIVNERLGPFGVR